MAVQIADTECIWLKNDRNVERCAVIYMIRKTHFAFCCEFCSENFTKFLSLVQHLIDHHEFENNSYNCTDTEDYASNDVLQEELEMEIKKESCFEVDTYEYQMEAPSDAEGVLEEGKVMPAESLELIEQVNTVEENKTKEEECKQLEKIKQKDVKVQKEPENQSSTSKGHPHEIVDLNYTKLIKGYKCNYCNRQFPGYSRVRTHLISHRTERRYKCSICGKVFKHSIGLKKHLKGQHARENPADSLERERAKTQQEECEHLEDVKLRDMKVQKEAALENSMTKERHPNQIVDSNFTKLNKGYKCNYCNREFPCRSFVRKHLVTHRTEFIYECSLCGKNFKHNSSLWRHLKSHSQEENFENLELIERANKGEETKIQEEAAHENPATIEGQPNEIVDWNFTKLNKGYKCNYCNREFPYHSEVRKHLISHRTEFIYECSFCYKAYKDNKSLNRHLRTHENPTTSEGQPNEIDANFTKMNDGYICNYCNRQFSKMYEARKHLVCHKTERKYECSLCGKNFKHNASLWRHLQSHSQEEPFENLELIERANKDEEKKNQEEAAHENPTTSEGQPNEVVDSNFTKLYKGYKCNYCNRRFSDRTKVRQHLISHRTERKYKCSICGRAFKDITNLNHHLNRHKGEKKFECPECSKKFHSNAELKAHIQRHRGEKNFLCTYCGARFITYASLTKHARRHTNTRPYKCDICPKSFFDLDHLKMHKKATHLNERSFKCNFCDASFNRPSTLRAHKQLHLDKREYRCTLCNAAFNQLPGLHSHMKGKHKILLPINAK